MSPEFPRVIILCGGLGTRLGEVARDVPKAMVRVAGMPFIAHQMHLLARENVKQVVPNWSLTHLFERIFPALREMGVAAEDLDHIVTENPRRYFEGVAISH